MNNKDEIVHQHSNHAGRGGGNGNSQTGAEGSLLTATAPTTISAHTMLLQLRDQQEERQRLLLAMPTDKGNQLQRQHQEWHSSASDIGLRVTETQPGFSLCNLNPNKQWQRSLLFSQPSPTQQMHNHNQSSSSGINSTTNAIDQDQIALLLRHLLQNTQHRSRSFPDFLLLYSSPLLPWFRLVNQYLTTFRSLQTLLLFTVFVYQTTYNQ